jgi:hypothetical protein
VEEQIPTNNRYNKKKDIHLNLGIMKYINKQYIGEF